MTGFSPRVRLLVRTRAGNGDAHDACCEACGIWLGEHGGQIQHRLARGRFGSKDPAVSGPAKGALLCGTSFAGCHGAAESRDEKHRMEERGFVIRHGNGPEFDPRYVAVDLFGGVEVWLSEDGRYLYEAPAAVAA